MQENKDFAVLSKRPWTMLKEIYGIICFCKIKVELTQSVWLFA
jgi:hypothetical protein